MACVGGSLDLSVLVCLAWPAAACQDTAACHTHPHRGSELLREVAWVVFDEVHYMQVCV